MSKLGEITEGFGNLAKKKIGFSDEQVEATCQERMAICNSCENKTPSEKCGLCGCYLAAKTRSMGSECPDKKWLKKDLPSITTES